MPTRRLVLVDGTAMVYRAFYGITELSTESGRPTNAVFGFIRMLRQIEEVRTPTHWAVVFDGGIPAERIELHSEYKANRPGMPDLLREQLSVVDDYLDRADVPWLLEEGQEADDVLASMATWAADDGAEVMIATSDKDLFQVVSENISIIPLSGRDDPMGVAGIEEKTGVPPGSIPEWLALIGDSSDNIPGVPGVGRKTATKLLREYGTIANVLAHLDELPGRKLRENMSGSLDLIDRNIAMVTLRTDMGSRLGWDELAVVPPDPARLLPLLDELEFHSMARALREPELLL